MRITYDEAMLRYGEEIVDKAMASDIEATSRMMYEGWENPRHLDKNEFSGEPVSTGKGSTLQAYYYMDSLDDLGDITGECIEFEEETTWESQ